MTDDPAWSKSNVERVRRLVEAGRMRECGLQHVEAAKPRDPTST